MNKIYSLLDQQFVLNFFKEKVLPFYPDIKEIQNIEIKPYKQLIWETTYHVVFAYNLSWLDGNNKKQKIQIVCSAHSNEPRENVLGTLHYLWDHNLPNKKIKLPRPLFYSQEFGATFYRAVPGHTLLHYIKDGRREMVPSLVLMAAEMFARLHQLPIANNFKFHTDNQRIATVVPGEKFISSELASRFKASEYEDLIDLYHQCASQETSNFLGFNEWSLIHGDAHPENIIKVGENKIGLIDFTDFCPADFARDIGAFLQQLEYKIGRKLNDKFFAQEMKKLFLDTYLRAAQKELSDDLQARINLYYDWTALRTAVYWFLNHRSSPDKGRELLYLVRERQRIGRNAQDLVVDYESLGK